MTSYVESKTRFLFLVRLGGVDRPRSPKSGVEDISRGKKSATHNHIAHRNIRGYSDNGYATTNQIEVIKLLFSSLKRWFLVVGRRALQQQGRAVKVVRGWSHFRVVRAFALQALHGPVAAIEMQ